MSDSYERFIQLRPHWGSPRRLWGSAWKQNAIPVQFHLGLPGRKTTLCGMYRRHMEPSVENAFGVAESDEVNPLPLCIMCRRMTNGEVEGASSSHIIMGRTNWYGRFQVWTEDE